MSATQRTLWAFGSRRDNDHVTEFFSFMMSRQQFHFRSSIDSCCSRPFLEVVLSLMNAWM